MATSVKHRSEMTPVQRLQADAREDYVAHQQPEVAADARNLHASGQATAGGNSGWHGRRK
jgi:hypothetical protein